MENTTSSAHAYTDLKPKWQERFAFFDAYGNPSSKSFRAQMKAMPLRTKALVNANWIAFFFGPIYLFVLGLWKKNVALIAGIIVLSFLIDLLEGALSESLFKAINNGFGIACSITYARLTNYAYYLKRVHGRQGWNPFEGHSAK